MQTELYDKRGYLLEEFRLFHLCDTAMREVDYHYHEFHKLIFFLSGDADYMVEGKRSRLEAGDIILIGSGCVHRPEVRTGMPYERVIIYISPAFLQNHSNASCDLERCFTKASAGGEHVLRPSAGRGAALKSVLNTMERALRTEAFGRDLLCRALLLQLLIELNRGVDDHKITFVLPEISDEKIVNLLRYINDNITEDMTIDSLAERFYISKYHMMRRFRAETGCSIHGYISDKRLLLARQMIAAGASATDACYRSGYRNYSSFSRAYKKLFQEPPKASGQRDGLAGAYAYYE